jgi:hypothetical protein
MAPRPTKGKAYMLTQLYEAENVPEDDRDTDEYTKLTINQILKRVDRARLKPAAEAKVEDEDEDDSVYRAWSAYRG